MVIRPYGYAIWEIIQRTLDQLIKKEGVPNAYFPLFIPESLLNKEKEQIEGFAPELAIVTIGGGKELAERLIVRPTSETIIYSMFSQWVQSYRDLPLRINQWANVVRWELRPRPFLRTTEFLWQEGHTAYPTEADAESDALHMLEVYESFMRRSLAIPVVRGQKTEKDKFPGALRTYTVEGLMHDGRGLQMGTSHNLGTNFSRTFDIQYLDAKGVRNYAWQTSWGVSTRLIGAIVMAHGDERGLRLPPAIAPVQCVIVPVRQTPEILQAIDDKIIAPLRRRHVRLEVDKRETISFGRKLNDWDLRGAPVRIEIGERELREQQVTVFRRDTLKKDMVSLDALPSLIPTLLKSIQSTLLLQAEGFLKAHTLPVETLEQLKSALEVSLGFYYTGWCGSPECEGAIKTETKATIRCIPLSRNEKGGPTCLVCFKPSIATILVARAY